MTFHELLLAVREKPLKEKRTQEENALEVVVTKSGLAAVSALLQSYFGAPLKPEGAAPSKEAEQASEPYGGIRRDQTMYLKKTDGVTEIALIWPWGSGDPVTVKIFRAE